MFLGERFKQGDISEKLNKNIADNEKYMNRTEFVKSAIRYLLLVVLAGIAILLGSKAVTGSNCSSCPGKGICIGESDCSKYLSDNYGGVKK
jgi:hypothetical protein